jgi:hypothetical protein
MASRWMCMSAYQALQLLGPSKQPVAKSAGQDFRQHFGWLGLRQKDPRKVDNVLNDVIGYGR